MVVRSLLALLVTSSCVLWLSACSDTPTNNPPANPVLGTWIIESAGGSDISVFQFSYTFTATQAVFTGDEGCKSTSNYTLNGSTMKMTNVSDECYGQPQGDTSTGNVTVAGSVLTMVSEGDTVILRKGTPHPAYVAGQWKVETIDGVQIPAGENINVSFVGNTLRMTQTGSTQCTVEFTFVKTAPTYLELTVVSDDCSDMPEGTGISLALESLTATTLAFEYQGKVFVARRV